MGNKLWAVLILVAGIMLALFGRQTKNRESQASFTPGTEQTIPAVQVMDSPPQVLLPCALEDGGLVAEELTEYEGPYVEDGTDDPVSGVAALMICNTGSRDISFGMVAVTQGDRVLRFFVTWLPAGERALVLEHDRATYSRDPVTGCRSAGVRWESFYPAGSSLTVSETDDTSLTVTNRCGQTLCGARLRYKIYMEAGDFYLGGVTYSAYVGTLTSGESRTVRPDHYAAGSAKVVALLTG